MLNIDFAFDAAPKDIMKWLFGIVTVVSLAILAGHITSVVYGDKEAERIDACKRMCASELNKVPLYNSGNCRCIGGE